VMNDKVTCANADLKADIERWHINKRKDFRKLFVNMADRQICYFQKVSIILNLIRFMQYNFDAVYALHVTKCNVLMDDSVVLSIFG